MSILVFFEEGEYKYFNDDWIHLKNHQDSHGCKNHPSISFLKNKAFLNIVNSNLIKKISIKLLNSEKTIMCPRMIVRSFSIFLKDAHMLIEIRSISIVLDQKRNYLLDSIRISLVQIMVN